MRRLIVAFACVAWLDEKGGLLCDRGVFVRVN